MRNSGWAALVGAWLVLCAAGTFWRGVEIAIDAYGEAGVQAQQAFSGLAPLVTRALAWPGDDRKEASVLISGVAGLGSQILLTDQDGQILLASDPRQVGRRLVEGARGQGESPGKGAALYLEAGRMGSQRPVFLTEEERRKPGPPLGLREDEYVHVKGSVGEEKLTLHVLAPAGDVGTRQEENLILGWAVFFAGAGLMSATHRRSELKRALKDHTVRDPLTGAFNRSYLDEIAPILFASHDRGTMASLSLVMFDIDRFKALNDSYGHAAADAAVKLFTSVLNQTARRSDVVCRAGDEEFVVFLPGADAGVAINFAERVQTSLKTHPHPAGASLDMFTVSAGVAVRNTRETLDGLLLRADEKLIAAKQAGRDRVMA